jgi:L-amino acid N-acyltransferase YncA
MQRVVARGEASSHTPIAYSRLVTSRIRFDDMTVTNPAFSIRPAAPEDAAALAAIYSHHVLHGTGTFEEKPIDADAMGSRLDAVIGRGWPWLVAVDDAGVAGYAYAAIFRDRSAYRFTCEDSVYIAPGRQRQGLGAALLAALLPAARQAGFERMIAVIGDADNAGSIRLHARADFLPAGRLHKAGLKFGRYLDVVLMEREL